MPTYENLNNVRWTDELEEKPNMRRLKAKKPRTQPPSIDDYEKKRKRVESEVAELEELKTFFNRRQKAEREEQQEEQDEDQDEEQDEEQEEQEEQDGVDNRDEDEYYSEGEEVLNANGDSMVQAGQAATHENQEASLYDELTSFIDEDGVLNVSSAGWAAYNVARQGISTEETLKVFCKEMCTKVQDFKAMDTHEDEIQKYNTRIIALLIFYRQQKYEKTLLKAVKQKDLDLGPLIPDFARIQENQFVITEGLPFKNVHFPFHTIPKYHKGVMSHVYLGHVLEAVLQNICEVPTDIKGMTWSKKSSPKNIPKSIYNKIFEFTKQLFGLHYPCLKNRLLRAADLKTNPFFLSLGHNDQEREGELEELRKLSSKFEDVYIAKLQEKFCEVRRQTCIRNPDGSYTWTRPPAKPKQ